MAVKFIPLDRDTPHLFPPSIQDYLPDDHLVRFVVDIFDPLDLSALTASDSGKGSQPYHPALWSCCFFTAMPPACFPLASRRRRPTTALSVYLCQHPPAPGQHLCFPPPIAEGTGEDVCRDSGAGQGVGHTPDGRRESEWTPAQGQCQQAQSLELAICPGAGGATEG